ncbi:hypothetical protein GCM10007094_23000 [Pseudovibrio japonicus]|uniref:HTH marR-type domain-containing protein n=1 Tax=Pseudovibrio japonicus TaxID=366534 RepID=A0ABQ3EGS8_9HYPH|nr:MarR family transcriptional regulator [Pseudovibrio japonicus]GHB33628.1 hypothetical protein GCM10007094_23000 [Pseudovibrio japonicus]
MKLEKLVEVFHRLAHREWAKQSGQLGLTHSEYEYLRAIKDQEARKVDKKEHGQHLQDVVDAIGVKKASASSMVVKLEERGLVERVPCRYDARAQHILLTRAGQNLLNQGDNIYSTVVQAFLQDLPAKDALEFKRAISRVNLQA